MMRFRFLASFALLALGSFSACSSDGDALDRARTSIEAGDLDHAERLLGGVESPRVAELRVEIAKLRERRTKLVTEVDALFARAGELTPNQVRDQLKRLRDRERDRGAREQIDGALSELTERFTAAEAARRARLAANPNSAPAVKPSSSAIDEFISRVRRDVREAIADQQWQRAESLLTMLDDQPAERLGDAIKLRDQVRESSRAEAAQLIGQAHDIERDVSASEAHGWLRKHAERFPPSQDFAKLHGLVSDLDERARRYVAPEDGEFTLFQLEDDPNDALGAEASFAAGAAETPEAPDLDSQALMQLAKERAEKGELAFARKCWLAASGKLFAGDLRDDCVGEAQDLRARIALREELAEALASSRSKLETLGVTAIDAAGWRVNGEATNWSELPFDLLQRVSASLVLSQLAQRGIIAEALRSKTEGPREEAAVELARMVDRGGIDSDVAANMISRALGGLGATQRYLLAQGKWSTQETVAKAAADATDQQLEKRFLRASKEQRASAFEELMGGASLDAVRSALAVRSAAAIEKLSKSRTLDQLRDLAELRTELDAKRKTALELIFDEQTYFYPYNPPPPPKTTTDYAHAQRDVDVAVEAVREAWRKSKPVKLSKDFLAAFDEFDWCAKMHFELKLTFALPASLPTWITALPREFESIELPQFAWSEREAEELAYSRRVEAYNERVWTALDAQKDAQSAASTPNVAEKEQVRITNRYRALMGRRSLAWNPKLQAAAQGHSEYMANTGDFGHFETDPKRHTPGDRMRLEGYNQGASENCAMVGGDPKSAHDGWAQSSGHHRNLLMAGHREMASGLASIYWTQNFGADRAFEKDLDP